MREKGPRPGLLSFLTKPLAKAARRVSRRDDGTEDEDDDYDVQRLMDQALREYDDQRNPDRGRLTARLTDESFRLAAQELRQETEGAFGIKLHIISLVEFHEAVGDRWFKISDKVMLIAEGVINMHLGAGNLFGRQGSDFFVLLFRTCDNDEARLRSVTIAQELGTRLVGDQFIGEERPLALAAELDFDLGLRPDGELNIEAVQGAIGEIRSLVARDRHSPDAPAWMRPGVTDAAPPPRRSLTPCAPEPPAPEVAGPIPMSVTGKAKTAQPGQDPGWKPIQRDGAPAKSDPAWVMLERGGDGTAATSGGVGDDLPPPLPADARLALIWRPTWVAQGETIGAYKARVMRVDVQDAPALEGVLAYPRADEHGIHTLDRFAIAAAVRAFRGSETAGNGSRMILPIHWRTLTASNRGDFLVPFSQLTQQCRFERVAVDIFGIPKDTTAQALAEVVAYLRPLCREVLVRSRLSAPRAEIALDAGATMVGIDLSELAQPERTDDLVLLRALDAFANHAAKARLGTYLWGVRRRKVVVGAVQTGFALVNGPALMKDIPRPAKVLPAPKSRLTSM